MNGLREKFRNKEGFTLIEMLIVVAIIAILVAVSIPLVGSALEKARDATDQANERAAKAAAAIKYLGVEDGSFKETTGTFIYDAVKGELVAEADKPVGYGQCTGSGADCYIPAGATAKESHDKKVIQVVIEAGGDIKMSWVEGKTGG